MKKILFIFVLLTFFLPRAYSQEDKLKLSVKSDKVSYKSGESIVLTAELKNSSEFILKTSDFIKPMENKYNQYFLEYVLTNEEGRVEDLRSQIIIPEKLMPGQSVTGQMTWTLHRRKHRSILGKQTIHVTLASRLSSEDITVEVASKDSESDKDYSGD
jgi:hypothetical protein